MGGMPTIRVYKGWLLIKPHRGALWSAYKAWGDDSLGPDEKPSLDRNRNILITTPGEPSMVSPDIGAIIKHIDEET